MNIQETKSALSDMKVTSERLKRGFKSMVSLAPQILEEEDIHELRGLADEVSSNFETCASLLYNFGRIGQTSKFVPQGRIDSEAKN